MTADDPVDISGMPDPTTIGLSAPAQDDPTAGMPEPRELFKKATGTYPATQYALDEFMKNPVNQGDYQPTLKKAASQLTGLPGAVNKAIGGSVAGAVGFLGGAAPGVGAGIVDPTNFGEHMEQAREGGRKGAAALTEGYSNLTDALSPWQTKRGKQFGNELTAAPGQIIGEASDSTLGKILPDNAYQMVADVGKDVGTVAPALGLPELGRGLVRGAKANVEAAKSFVAKEKASASGEQPAATAAAAATAQTTPDVGTPVTGEQLRNQPNPIPPPEGTVAAAREEARGVPKAAPQEAPAPSPNDVSPPAQQEGAPAPPAAAVSPGGAERGSVRIFNAPMYEGPQETPAPETVPVRQQHLDDLDKLSGGALPTRRTSALTGDYNATGNDWQMAKAGNETMQTQLATENDAMHAAMDNIHKSTGSLQPDSVDPTTLGNRGHIVRGAIQGIEDHFNKATDNIYDAARATSGTAPMPNFLGRASSFLADDANYMPEGFRRAAQARLQQLKTSGDAGIKGDGSDASAPGSVGAAEKFREWLNANRTLDNMHTTRQLVNHTDMDVAENGGPGLFRAARAQRTHQAQMLEEPAGIKKLLAPGDSQGINHAIPEHKVMDYIDGLDREQHEHVMNVLRAGAHLSPELAESSAAAIREIQAHTISRLHDAATNDGGKWNARDFYNASSQYARNAASTFKDRPDIVKNLKTVNDAGNTLHLDKNYPGATGSAVRSGALANVAGVGGRAVASVAHDIPVVGRMVGRAIENATENATGEMGKRALEKAAAQRIVDRTGKQRGAVGDLSQRRQIELDSTPLNGSVVHRYTPPATHFDPNFPNAKGGSMTVVEHPDLGVSRVQTSVVTDKGKGWGTQMLAKAADDAHARGQVLHSDQQVSEGQAGAYKNLAQLGYDVKMKDNNHRGGAYHAVGDHVFEVRPPKTNGSTLNVGLHQGAEGSPNFHKMSKQEAQGAVESTGAKVTKSSVLTPEAHGVPEPTAVLSTNRPLAEPEMQKVLAQTKQSAIPQRTDAGVESMHVAPGHEEIAKREGWDKFDPNQFRGHPDQRGSVQLFNDNKLNRSAENADNQRRGVGINPRNERNERVANQQMGGRRPLSDEQNDILNRLSGGNQRGSVRVMNEKPLEGAPEGDRPNGKARAAATAYMKSAGIKNEPLSEYRFIDPKVAKNVADAYEEMKHDPTNPKVAKSYDAFKAETLAQYKQMQKAGVKVDLNADYPYKNPREMHADVRDNNHMTVFPSEAGFGSSDVAAADHPLMEKAPIKVGGKDATYNDLFRAVHDYYGHAAEGNGFRANGEYNAWRAHRQMYSPEARGAMDAETLGQNSWVNSGPAAALNKGASGADTIYADQKAGLLPKKVVDSAVEGVGANEHHITNQLTDKERAQLRTDTSKRLVDAFNSAPATKEYAAAALAGAAKRGWYKNSAQAIVNQFGPDAPRFAGLLSAMSPQVSVQTNFANALKTFVNWDKAGRPEDPSEIRAIMEASSQKSAKAAPGSSNVLDAWVNNAVRALTAEDPTNIKLSGPKVHSFYHNLTNNVHEVTNDAWMASFAKIDPSKMSGSLNQAGPGKSPTYLAMSAKVRDAARMLSHLTGETWTPAEVQETVWSWTKTAYEHAEEMGDQRSIPDLVKNGDITDELIRSTPDFHQLFGTSEHRGLLQSSSFAGNAAGLDKWQKQGTDTTGASKTRQAAEAALRPALISAAKRLEQVRQERRAAGQSAPKEEE